jgi:hypothetical protein
LIVTAVPPVAGPLDGATDVIFMAAVTRVGDVPGSVGRGLAVVERSGVEVSGIADGRVAVSLPLVALISLIWSLLVKKDYQPSARASPGPAAILCASMNRSGRARRAREGPARRRRRANGSMERILEELSVMLLGNSVMVIRNRAEPGFRAAPERGR